MLMPVKLLVDHFGDRVVWSLIPDNTPDLGALEFVRDQTAFVPGRAYFCNEKAAGMPPGCVLVTTAENYDWLDCVSFE